MAADWRARRRSHNYCCRYRRPVDNVLLIWVSESGLSTLGLSLEEGSWGYPTSQTAALEPGDHVVFASGVSRGPRQPEDEWLSQVLRNVWHGVATTGWYEDHVPRHTETAFPYRFDFVWQPPVHEQLPLTPGAAFSREVALALREAGVTNSARSAPANGLLFLDDARLDGSGTTAEPRQRRLDWTREEVILAMDLYVNAGALNGGPIPGKTSAPIVELSQQLKALSAHPAEHQGNKYRNPDGVYLKLTNLRAVETDGAHGMKAFSQLDAATWREFIDDLPRLHEEAAAIRLRLAEHKLDAAEDVPRAVNVPIENQNTERYFVHPSGEMREAERAEQGLVLRYRDWMQSRGAAVVRRRYTPAGEVSPIYCDAWIEERSLLIEAKNSDNRQNIRSAIGQLYDYRRFHDPTPKLAVLLPYPPAQDRRDLLASAGIEALWPHGDGFRGTADFLT